MQSFNFGFYFFNATLDYVLLFILVGVVLLMWFTKGFYEFC